MTQSFFVPGPLPGWREVIAAATSGHGRSNGYARLKKEWTAVVAIHARSARMKSMDGPVMLSFVWYETRLGRKRGRDRGNILAGEKFVCDGLVDAGVLPDDGPDVVVHQEHDWHYGSMPPGVKVMLENT